MHAPEKDKAIPLAHLSAVWPPREPPRPWEIGRGRVWPAAAVVFAILFWGVPAFFRWPHIVSSWGGRYFIRRTVIFVPPLQQNDPLWSEQLLGNTYETLGQAGCAVTSAAMVLRAYGVDTDPARLNLFLEGHLGYVGDGLLDWDRVSGATGEQVQKAYENYPSYALIDAEILRGNPVIVRLRLHNGTTHFAVIVGKQGWSYLIRDPARPAQYGVYPLHLLTSRIEALRFYTIVPPPKPRPAKTPAPPGFVPPAPVAPGPNVNTLHSSMLPPTPPAETNQAPTAPPPAGVPAASSRVSPLAPAGAPAKP